LPEHKAEKQRPSHLAPKRSSWLLYLLPAPVEYLINLASLSNSAWKVLNDQPPKQFGFDATCTRLPPRHGVRRVTLRCLAGHRFGSCLAKK
jgi:hypothetical protein